ncbi:MAG: GNAT family protein [Micropruina sp.]|uniref:GNAT family N-acetyltransferase n=1 Tax=Micropruina sp. TaxID=2737536 RepID=UPI0039E43BB9
MTAEHRTLAEAYPVLGLRIVAGPIELSGMDDDTLIALANLAVGGIHGEDEMPFAAPWTRTPPERFQLQYLQHHWGVRSRFAPAAWDLDLAVRYEGELVGSQGVMTRDFLATRTGETGSWLGRRFQGRGIGTLMRQTFCAFLFDHLGFDEITSSAFADNPASNQVSRKVGYRPNGVGRKARDDTWVTSNEYLLTPDALVRGPGLSVTGVEPVRRLIGLE